MMHVARRKIDMTDEMKEKQDKQNQGNWMNIAQPETPVYKTYRTYILEIVDKLLQETNYPRVKDYAIPIARMKTINEHSQQELSEDNVRPSVSKALKHLSSKKDGKFIHYKKRYYLPNTDKYLRQKISEECYDALVDNVVVVDRDVCFCSYNMCMIYLKDMDEYNDSMYASENIEVKQESFDENLKDEKATHTEYDSVNASENIEAKQENCDDNLEDEKTTHTEHANMENQNIETQNAEKLLPIHFLSVGLEGYYYSLSSEGDLCQVVIKCSEKSEYLPGPDSKEFIVLKGLEEAIHRVYDEQNTLSLSRKKRRGS